MVQIIIIIKRLIERKGIVGFCKADKGGVYEWRKISFGSL